MLRCRDRGTCTNKLTIPRPEVEQRVLGALQDKLLRKDFFEEECREFAKEMNRLRMEQRAGLSGAKRELERVKSEIQKVIEAIEDGVRGPELKDRDGGPAGRKDALLEQLEDGGRTAAASASEHGRPLPQQGRGTRVGAPSRGHPPGSLRDAPRADRFDCLDA